MLRLILAAIASCLMITGAISQDGSRAYFLLPANTNIASLTTNVLHTEAGGSQFDAFVVTPSYRRSVDIGGNAGSVLIALPVGALSAALNTGFGIVDLKTDLAPGDLIIGGDLGLIGSPSLAPMDYAQYKPGFRAGVAAKLYLPTGNYDSSRLLNMGQNRWSLQASVPISYVMGDSMIDPNITTFELVPGVHIFGDNTDAFGPAAVSTQQPLFNLEAHVTHNFAPTVWAGLDAYYELGGQAFADGVAVGMPQNSLSVGASLGLVLSRQVAVRLSYLEQVISNGASTVDRSFELSTAFSF